MANGRLSFSIALNLATQQFKAGASQAKAAIKGIQYQVLGMASALGLGGIGLSNLVSRFIDVARETNRARVALKNISGDAGGFGKNMSFLNKLANQYGQDLNSLTGSFAKFSAAAGAASVPMQDQYKIYTSMTRAVTAFGLSGDEANLSFMALSQMMSKGKISSEELRRQMGERIPIAMEAMARAAGVTVQELDKLLKNGEIYSAEVLPRFAEELDKMLGDVNTDNIETSVNRLKNVFTKMTDNMKIGDFYKKIVDGAAKMLGTIQQSFLRFAGIIAGVMVAKIIKGYLNYQIQAVAAHNKVALSAQKAAWFEEAAQSGLTRKQQIEVVKRKTSELLALQQSQTAYKKFAITASAAFRSVGAAMMSILPVAILSALGYFLGKIIEVRKESKRIRDIFSEYQKEVKSVDTGKEVSLMQTLLSVMNDRKSTQSDINKAQTQLQSMLGTEIKSQEELNKKVADRIKLLEATAKANLYVEKKASAEERISEIYGKHGGESEMNKKYISAISTKGILNKAFNWQSSVERDMNELIQLRRVVADSKAAIEGAVRQGIDITGSPAAIPTVPVAEPVGVASETKKEKDIIKGINVLEMLGKMMKKPSVGAVEDIGPSMVGIEQRDPTFDYKKSDTDILSEQYEIANTYINRLKEEGKTAFEEILLKERDLMGLSEALKVAELKEDIEDFNKQIFNESIDGFINTANAIDGIANAWQRVADSDLSGWEKMISIINALGDTVNGLVGAWELYNTIKSLTASRDAATTAAQVASDATAAASSATKSSVVVGGLMAEEAAATGVMAALSTAAYAAIPFAGPGLAGAQIAAMKAMIAAAKIPMFADGGIIGGSSYSGDKLLGRFNSGEMVINRVDQGKLFRAIKSGNIGGGQTEFKIKGKDLVAVLGSQVQKNSRI